MFPAEELKKRTKQFAIRIVTLFRSLPRSEEPRVLAGNASFWDVGSGELSRCLPRSIKGRVHREGWVVVEEADETVLWLELLVDTEIVSENRMSKAYRKRTSC